MDEEDKKAIKIMILVPGISILIGLILLFILKMAETSIPFLAIGIFGYIFDLTIYFCVKYSENRIEKAKNNNEYIMSEIEEIKELEKELIIITTAVINEKSYEFTECYKVKNESLDLEINQKLKELNINSIRIWIDKKNYNNFDFDIEDLLKKIDINEKLESIYWEAIEK